MSAKRTLADFGRDSFTPILGRLVPWDGSVLVGGERIFLTIDHGQIVTAEIPSADLFWIAEGHNDRHWRGRRDLA
jgi:hypothetical protein